MVQVGLMYFGHEHQYRYVLHTYVRPYQHHVTVHVQAFCSLGGVLCVLGG